MRLDPAKHDWMTIPETRKLMAALPQGRFVGGAVRWMVDRMAAKGRDPDEAAEESEISPGNLYASGLIAAGGIVGLIGVCIKLYEAATEKNLPRFSDHNPLYHDWVSVVMFGLLAYSLYYFARKPMKKDEA